MRLIALPAALLLCAASALGQDLGWLDASGASKLRAIMTERRDQFATAVESFQALGRPLDERDAARRAWYKRRTAQLTAGIEVLSLRAAGRELSDDYFSFVARAFEVYEGQAEAPTFVDLIPQPRLLEPSNESAIVREVTALVADLDTPVQLPQGAQSERERLEAQVQLLDLQKQLARLEAQYFETEAQLARAQLDVIETDRLIRELESRQED